MKDIEIACLETLDIDRDIPLEELIQAAGSQKLARSLKRFFAEQYAITKLNGETIIGNPVQDPIKLGIAPELEDIGYLQVNQQNGQLARQVLPLILQILDGGRRYLLASALHLQAKQDDYQALLEKHQALQKSEAKYKALSKQLEQRVEQQVQQIDQSRLQLYQAEKLASVGQLAAGVAHELNTPIGFVMSNLNAVKDYWDAVEHLVNLVKTKAPQDYTALDDEHDLEFMLEDFPELMQESIAGLTKVSQIISDLRAFANVDASEVDAFDINECIREVVSLTHNSLAHKPDIQLQLGQVPHFKCHPAAIGQLLLNLLQNAAAAVCNETGQITFRSTTIENTIQVEIEDNGSGIPKEIINRVFDPFFTTQDVGSGTGLGLTVCRDIMQAHKGEIKIESQPDQGTKITLVFPIGALDE